MDLTSEMSKMSIGKLNGENFYSWKFNIEMYLKGVDVWDIVTGDEVLPERATEDQKKKFKKRDQFALSKICLSVTENVQIYVRNCKTAKDAWDSLSGHFQENTLSKKIHWYKKLYAARMGPNTTMEEHVNNIKIIAEHLESLGDPIQEKYLVMILISSLPDSYNNLITTLETLKEEQLTWNYTRDRVMSEYERKKDKKKKNPADDDALFTGNKGNYNNNNNQKKKFGGKKKFFEMECHHCKQKGHFRRDCEKWKKAEAEKRGAAAANTANAKIPAAEVAETETVTFEDRFSLEFGLFAFAEISENVDAEDSTDVDERLSDDTEGGDSLHLSTCAADILVKDTVQVAVALINDAEVSAGDVITDSLLQDPEGDVPIVTEDRHQNSVGDFSVTISSPDPYEDMQPTFSSEFALAVGESSVGSVWWIDSGATQHMSSDKKDFINYTAFENPIKVNLADKSYLLANGWGQIPLQLFDVNREVNVLLNNALYIPKIQNKLFSVSSAVEDGGALLFDKKGVVLRKDNKSRNIGVKKGKLYQLNCEPADSEESCCLAKQDSVLLWHERFGHLNKGDLKLLNDKEMVTGLKLSPIDETKGDVCHGCALGKSKRSHFPKKSKKTTTKPLELIHSDVLGPIHVPSLGRSSRYFVTFTDDFSRFVTVYILQTKDEVIEKFEEFLDLVENQHESKVKKFRSDGGGEYISNEFSKVCKSRGIAVNCSIRYTPQQNGVSERMNRTLMEMARSMLYHANLPQNLWAEAVSTAAYLRNRCPTSSFKGATPYERWFGVKPDVNNLQRIYSCVR